MQKSPLQLKQTVVSEVPTDAIATGQILRLVDDWLADCRIRQHSARTIELRRVLTNRLLWFLEKQGALHCSRAELRQFFSYLAGGHQDGHHEAGGRWGKSSAQFATAMRPATLNTYFQHLRTFFNWCVGEEYLTASPMAKMTPPLVRADQVKPFTSPQITALLNATARSKYPRRDEALVRFLLDTGVRASELCELKMKDLDLLEGQAYVLGKGNKIRMVCFGRKTARALRSYLREDERTPEQCVFLSERGESAGAPFTRWGARQVIERLGEKAKIKSVRCSPHTFRHTFAVEFLRNGGNVFTLKSLLGHTGLQVTNRYVALAQADIQSQHRQFAPGDRM